MIAQAAIILWPLIGVAMFRSLGRMKGIIWVTLVGYLFLPSAVSIPLPALPSYERGMAISVALVLGLLVSEAEEPGPARLGPPVLILLVLGAFAHVFTSLSNGDVVIEPFRVLTALGLPDIRRGLANYVIDIIPLVLACRYLGHLAAVREVGRAIVVLGVIYGCLALIEVRMSPQFHSWVYGYFPSSWAQHVRDGYRPTVFLPHGLTLGMFLLTVVTVAAGRVRDGGEGLALRLIVFVFVTVVLLMSKNFGALLLSVAALSLIFTQPRKVQVLAAAIIGLGFIFYPVLRQSGLIPFDAIVDWIASIHAGRASSFNTRLLNEQVFLDRLDARPLFGWGGWGRARVLSESGRDLVLADGGWILRLVQFGWYGFLVWAALITLPVLSLLRASARIEITPLVASFAVAMAMNYVYLIPNSTFSPIGWLIAGMLIGYATAPQGAAAEEDDTATSPTGPRRGPLAYTRFADGPATPHQSARQASSGTNRGRGPRSSRRTS